MPRPIRILLADDHTVVRDGLRALLERQPDMAVVAEAGDGRECLQMAELHLPDVVLMDVAMPEMNGIEAARRIIADNPKTGVEPARRATCSRIRRAKMCFPRCAPPLKAGLS